MERLKDDLENTEEIRLSGSVKFLRIFCLISFLFINLYPPNYKVNLEETPEVVPYF